MAKLIIKHELPPPTLLEKLADVVQLVLPVVLVTVAIAVAVSLYLSSSSGTDKAVAVMPSPAVTTQLPESYLSEESHLNSMALEFDELLDEGVEGHDKHQQLVNKAEAILAQLSTMDEDVSGMALSDADKQILQSRHQYQKDYWESKLVFHRLRMARFKINGLPEEAEPNVAETVPATEPETVVPVAAEPQGNIVESADEAAAGSDTTAKAPPAPPPGVKLPEGFCPLFGPGAAECKANAKNKPE